MNITASPEQQSEKLMCCDCGTRTAVRGDTLCGVCDEAQIESANDRSYSHAVQGGHLYEEVEIAALND